MTYFGQRFLDELRAALSVRAVVERRHKLRKVGASEYQAVDDASLKVNDAKNVWNDFSKGKAGDIIAFEQYATGCTFEQAVETLASIAGLALPSRPRRPPGGASSPPSQDEREEPPPEAYGDLSARSSGGAPIKQIVATYDYRDAEDGELLYQVCRMEWAEGGKKHKTFLQRRPVPGGDGWAWALSAGSYLKSNKNGDWYVATEDRVRRWVGAVRRDLPACPHSLYMLPELREELDAPQDEQRVVFVTEGEKDADTLAAWGCVATTNSGGAKHWTPALAEELRDADVVILLDNDKAGRERGHLIAGSLRGIARRTRVLSWLDWWPTCPDKADVTDWRDYGGGTAEKLFAILDKLPEWTPQVPETRFNALRYVDLDAPGRTLEWLVKGVITRGECSIWYGPPGCGKSFLLTDAAMAVARGVMWMGQRTRPGLVIYQAGEGGLGLKNRLKAYRERNRIPRDDDLPFVLLPSRVDLFHDNADVDKLIAEIKLWAAYYDTPLELVVIDTFNAASPGANENASEDVGRVLDRARRISVETSAHVALVHHTSKAGGSPRGHSSLLGNVDNAIEVDRTDQVDEEVEGSNRVRREIRQFVITKQKDAEDRLARQFVLRAVQIGRDADNDPITSCVVSEVGNRIAAVKAATKVVPKGWFVLNESNIALFRALESAIEKVGRSAPPTVPDAPPSARCVMVKDWHAEYVEQQLGYYDDVTDKLRATMRKRVNRACAQWVERNVLGKSKEYIWRTSRRVYGIDKVPEQLPLTDPTPIYAPGETERDLADLAAQGGMQ